MPKIELRRLPLVGGGLAVAGAALIVAGAPAQAANRCQHQTLRHKDSGRLIIVQECDRVRIRLRQQSDGGYTWKVAHAPNRSVLKKVSDKTVVPKHATPGASTTRVFVYQAVGDGSTRLKLVESRSFQHHSQISKFKLSVEVK